MGRRAKPTQESQERAVAKWLRDSGNTGRGPEYTPWLNVRSFSSRGQSNRIRGRASGREHHLFSVLEADCLYLLDWQEGVLDIREQYPLLPLEDTQEIAWDLGVRHPTSNGVPVVMTTDFLVTRSGRFGSVEEAIAVKPSQELEKVRVQEKLEIERLYWSARFIGWGLVTEKELPKGVVQAIRWASAMRDLTDFHLSPGEIDRILSVLEQRINDTTVALSALCLDTDGSLGIPPGTALTLVRHALVTRRWLLDFSDGINPGQPLTGVVVQPPEPLRRG